MTFTRETWRYTLALCLLCVLLAPSYSWARWGAFFFIGNLLGFTLWALGDQLRQARRRREDAFLARHRRGSTDDLETP